MDTNSQLESINNYLINLSLVLSLILKLSSRVFHHRYLWLTIYLYPCFLVMIMMKISADFVNLLKIFQPQIDADFL